jgi:Zn-dependent protease with chaperone function
VLLNPAQATSDTLAHEMGHISRGHTAMKVPASLHLPANLLLDMSLELYFLFGDYWWAYTGFLVLLGIVVVRRNQTAAHNLAGT